MSLAGKASGSRRARRAMYCAVHSPMPRIGAQPGDRLLDRAEGAEQMRVGDRGLGQRGQRRPARPGHAERAEIGRGHALRRREGAGQGRAQPRRLRHLGAAESTPAGRRGCARRDHGDLLAQHGAHRQLEPVPAAGRAQAGPLRHQRRQERVLRQMGADRLDVGAEIEHPAHPGQDAPAGRGPRGSGSATARLSRAGSCRISTVPMLAVLGDACAR